MPIPQYDWIAHHAAYSPQQIAHVDLYSNRRFTYLEMDARVASLASHLQHERHIEPGDRISLLAYNSTDAYEIFFAAQRIGAIVLPLNWRLALPELEFIVADAEPKLLIYGEDFAEVAHALAASCNIGHLIRKRDGEPSEYEAIVTAMQPACTQVPCKLDDIWMLMYTSGTTGRPKGAQLTYQAHLFNAINATMKCEITRSSTCLVFLPQFHVGGICMFAFPCFHLGATTIVMRQFDPPACLDLLSDAAIGITHTIGVPTNYLLLAQLPQFAAADFSHTVALTIGGASAPLSLLQTYADKDVILQQVWGMTETCTMGTLLDKASALERLGSCGRKVLHTELQIADPDGKELPTGETGELLIRGPLVTPGYWRKPEVNKASFIDGWFKTGDAAYVDADGFYYIVDRWKDMYISGGENVYPAEVENVIYGLDCVAECAVIGIADETWGQIGRAFIVLKDGANASEKLVADHCMANLAKFKVPRSIRFVDELPHNATGKVTKHELPRD